MHAAVPHARTDAADLWLQDPMAPVRLAWEGRHQVPSRAQLAAQRARALDAALRPVQGGEDPAGRDPPASVGELPLKSKTLALAPGPPADPLRRLRQLAQQLQLPPPEGPPLQERRECAPEQAAVLATFAGAPPAAVKAEADAARGGAPPHTAPDHAAAGAARDSDPDQAAATLPPRVIAASATLAAEPEASAGARLKMEEAAGAVAASAPEQAPARQQAAARAPVELVQLLRRSEMRDGSYRRRVERAQAAWW